MKKILVVVGFALALAPFAASAQEACNIPQGIECPSNKSCSTQSGLGSCSIASCNLGNGIECPSGQKCSADVGDGLCQGNITLPNPSSPGSPSSGGTPSGFKAIAPIPGLTDSQTVGQSSTSITNFLNNLYKFLIGIAAVIVVIQIIRGGIMIATSDSIGSHGEGRKLIEQSIFGLVLILAPVLVFSIINPSILNLGVTLSPIKVQSLDPSAQGTTVTSGGGSTITQTNSVSKCQTPNCDAEIAECNARNSLTLKAEGVKYDPLVVCVKGSGDLDSAGTHGTGSSLTCIPADNKTVQCQKVEITGLPSSAY